MARHEADIWMPLDIGKYLSDTQHLTTLQHGAYLLLLMSYWKRGPFPNDPEQLAAICKLDPSGETWLKAWVVISPYFHVGEDGLLHNDKADKEIAKAASIVQAQSKGGASRKNALAPERRSEIAREAANARWKTKDLADSNACSMPAECLLNALPSPSPSHINTNPPIPPQAGERRKRRTRTEILSPYPPEVSALVNEILPHWPKVQPKDKSPIHFDVPMTAERIDGLLRQQGVTAEILKQAASKYLGEQKNYYRAPQFFFGPGAGEKSPPWVAYARMSVHQEATLGLQ